MTANCLTFALHSAELQIPKTMFYSLYRVLVSNGPHV